MADSRKSPGTVVWAFDIGTGSFGYAVRQTNGAVHRFAEVRSLLVPAELASVDVARTRRRMMRTREAHKAREAWLRQCFSDAGLSGAILSGRRTESAPDPASGKMKWITRPGDWRLEREFPPQLGTRSKDGAPSDETGASTCYCGALLRIKLLQGETLAPWQVFKALHGAIQKRGFDPDVPWKNRGRGDKRDDDEAGETLKRANAAEDELRALSRNNPDRHLPCYLEAAQMGLWDPAQPSVTSRLRQDCHAQPARGRVFFRATVERELRALLASVEKLLPALSGKTDFILHGPAGVEYASFKPSGRAAYKAATGVDLIEGKAADWQGVLGQKIPTFDNRAVEACALIPRFHTAKAAPKVTLDAAGKVVRVDEDSLLPAEVSFLMKLKNLRFAVPGGSEGRFSAPLIREIFEAARKKALESGTVEAFALNKTALQKWIKRENGVALLPNQEVVESPRGSGRARFSKPALRIVRRLILSGNSPAEAHAEELAKLAGHTDKLKGLVADDLAFLERITSKGGEQATWAGFYLPDESLSFVENAGNSKEQKIRALIGRQNNPIIRHRLETFWRLLQQLEERHGPPDFIALEFVREDFMGEKARLELAAFQKKRREARNEARAEVGAGKDMLKYQLMKDQGGVCLFCGEGIGIGDLPNCEVEHIVPGKMGGPGAYWNFCVACRTCNTAKARRTPFEWNAQGEFPRPWDGYVQYVRSKTFTLKPKKVRLLTEPNAAELVVRYQSLAETAWIARLAQTLVCLNFGWPRNFLDGQRRVRVLPGGLTARVRRKYQLNSLLGQDIAALEAKLAGGDAKAEHEIDKKCRADKRHHALDAMVLSFLPQWTADPTKAVRVKLPDAEGVHRDFFRTYLDTVVPTNLCFEKPALEDSAYGARTLADSSTAVATKRFELRDLGFTGQNPVFKLDTLRKDAARIIDRPIREAIQRFIADHEPDGPAWIAFCDTFRHPANPSGPVVKRVRRIVADSLEEFRDLSKGDKRPALRRGDRHQGYFLYADSQGKVRVQPVYVFQSSATVRQSLQRRMGADVAEIIDFFQSGCAVSLSAPVDHPKTPLAAGVFKLNSIWATGFARLTSASGVVSEPISVQKLLAAGLSRT